MKKRYKDKYDFAEQVINSMPWVKNYNVKVTVSQYITSFEPLKGETFSFGGGITDTFSSHLQGVIDGLGWAYDELKGDK